MNKYLYATGGNVPDPPPKKPPTEVPESTKAKAKKK